MTCRECGADECVCPPASMRVTESTRTIVVNKHKALEWDVDITRTGDMGGYFGNPFTGPDRDENIARFKAEFQHRIMFDAPFRKAVEGLRGKTLGCVCHPKPCHGDVYVAWLNRPESRL